MSIIYALGSKFREIHPKEKDEDGFLYVLYTEFPSISQQQNQSPQEIREKNESAISFKKNYTFEERIIKSSEGKAKSKLNVPLIIEKHSKSTLPYLEKEK